jgi:NADH-quinone oxidoreductase subunit G
MPKLTIDGIEVEVEVGSTVLQACESAGVEVPRFCYHERLEIAGNCRMCLVQIEGGPPKPAASCAMPAGEGMVVHTKSEMVKKAREGVMEFLLINHPLDCPICDQGGECDLQDQAMMYGRGESRCQENKRAVKEGDYGPLIKTTMTRCIHCTRCVRFITDVAGTDELGAVNRGEHMEVGTYVKSAIASELSGNIIDLCPVGALTSRPYEFKARSWELRKTESIDVLDAVGSSIRVDARGQEVMRILPRLNEDVNEEWLSDKARFAYDGLKLQRLDRPYIRKNGKLIEASWADTYSFIAEKLGKLDGKEIAAIAGDLSDAESIYALKNLMSNLGSGNIDCRQDGAKLDVKSRASYLFNTTISGIEQADACLFIGTNPRVEAPVLNARIRKTFLKNRMPLALVGSEVDLTYKYDFLGNDLSILNEILDGSHEFAKKLEQAENPMLIIGQDALKRQDAAAVLFVAKKIADKYGLVKDNWNGFNVLQKSASRVAAMDMGFVPDIGSRDVDAILEGATSGDIKAIYLLGADEIDMSRLGRAFVIYQGHHGDKGVHRADVILPGAAYTEKSGTYINTEGRVQRTEIAVYPPHIAKSDWLIITEIASVLDKDLPCSSLEEIRNAIAQEFPHFANIDAITPAKWEDFGSKGDILSKPLSCAVNYYMTDSISRSSKTMAECSSVFVKPNKEAA